VAFATVEIEERKKDKETLQWQTGIRPDHPRRLIEIKFCMGVVFGG